jgi:hypothetical protein
MRLTQLVVAVVATLSSTAALGSQASPPTVLPGPLRAHVMGERFQIVTSTRGLPLGVRDELQALFGGQLLEIVAPGDVAKTNSTLVDPVLPVPRLTLAGCALDHCLVYYVRSGAKQSWHVALFHWMPAATRIEFSAVAPGGLTSIDEVKKVVVSGAIKGLAQK